MLKKYSQEIQEKKTIYKNQPQTIKKMAIGTYISIITLNVNGLNAPMHQKAQTGWMDTRIRTMYMLSTRNLLET